MDDADDSEAGRPQMRPSSAPSSRSSASADPIATVHIPVNGAADGSRAEDCGSTDDVIPIEVITDERYARCAHMGSRYGIRVPGE